LDAGVKPRPFTFGEAFREIKAALRKFKIHSRKNADQKSKSLLNCFHKNRIIRAIQPSNLLKLYM